MTEPSREQIENASNALTGIVNAWHLALNPEDLDLIAYIALKYQNRPVDDYQRTVAEVDALLEEHGHCGSPFGRKIPLSGHAGITAEDAVGPPAKPLPVRVCSCEGDRELFLYRGDPEWWRCVACDKRVRPLTDVEQADRAI